MYYLSNYMGRKYNNPYLCYPYFNYLFVISPFAQPLQSNPNIKYNQGE
jgi:hypothetical protein